jgi:hypothetical protein
MKRNLFYKIALTFCSSVIFAQSAHADGSVSFSENIKPILNSRPLFEKFINQSFSISDAGWGTRIDSPTMPHMGGARMGPYRFHAIWHSPNGDVPVTLVIDTKIQFFDAHRKEIRGSDLRNTTSISEILDAIEIEPPASD